MLKQFIRNIISKRMIWDFTLSGFSYVSLEVPEGSSESVPEPLTITVD